MILKKLRRDVPLCINDGNVGHMDKRLLLNLPPHDVAHQCNAMQLHTGRSRLNFFNIIARRWPGTPKGQLHQQIDIMNYPNYILCIR